MAVEFPFCCRRFSAFGVAGAVGMLAVLCAPAAGDGFGGPALEIGIGSGFAGYRQTFQPDRVALTNFEPRLALSEGFQASWGGLIRGGVALRYLAGSAKQTSTWTFYQPSDTYIQTGQGTTTQTLNTGLSGELFLEPGFAFNEFIAVVAHAGYECGQLSWSQTWDYNNVYTTAHSRDTSMLCGPTLGGRVIVNPNHIAEFSIGAVYRYAEGSRQKYVIDETTHTGTTANEFRIEVNWIVPL